MGPTIDNHTVPQVYLKRFADDRRELLVFEKGRTPEDMIFSPDVRPVRDISARPDFYTLLGEDGKHDAALEAEFSRLENYYRPLFKALKSRKQLSADHLGLLSLLAALQDARSIGTRELWAENIGGLTSLVERTIRHHRPDAKESEIADAMKRSIRREMTSLDVATDPANLALLMIPDVFKTRYDIMRKMHKCILVSNGRYFMTSNNPVVWIDPLRWPPRPFDGFNFLRLSNEVIYPLTKRFCLLMSFMPLVKWFDAAEEVVKRVNARLARYSDELYAYPAKSPNERLAYLQDAASDDDTVRRPLIWHCLDRSGSGIIMLRAASDDLGAPWADVVRGNQPIIDGWRERGFADVVWGDPETATP